MRLVTLCSVAALFAGCASKGYAPVQQNAVIPEPAVRVMRSVGPSGISRQIFPIPTMHRVAEGETLHSVAWLYGIDHRDLIRWNELQNPDLILAGQVFYLMEPSHSRGRTVRPPDQVGLTIAPSRHTEIVQQKPKEPVIASVKWVWPANGEIRSSTGFSGSNGIEILGTKGEVVKAAGAGTVVYSGRGLRGYGELIIVKHSGRLLSAYAHNDVRLTEEGRSVSAGETIAHMGSTDSKKVKLYFEIRRNGKAIDPLKVLPKR